MDILANRALPSPAQLLAERPRTESQARFVAQARGEIHEALFTDGPRFLLIIGPCSIHDPKAGLDYARRLAALAAEVSDRVLVVMRVYFEKPRTTVGWKGLIMDPHLDGSHDIATGLNLARGFLQEVLDLGLPTATELLDPITHHYLEDLLCWSAIGARTVESQTHRQMASGLPMPMGFKNGTDGHVATAVDAIQTASQPHTFMGTDPAGFTAVVATKGNPDGHLVLRGGHRGPNHSPSHIAQAERLLARAGLAPSILVDCSHGNSAKHPERQPEVLEDILAQIAKGNSSIKGAMIESNLEAGNQPFPVPKEQLRYGVSITDACIDWETTEKLVRRIHSELAWRAERRLPAAWEARSRKVLRRPPPPERPCAAEGPLGDHPQSGSDALIGVPELVLSKAAGDPALGLAHGMNSHAPTPVRGSAPANTTIPSGSPPRSSSAAVTTKVGIARTRFPWP